MPKAPGVASSSLDFEVSPLPSGIIGFEGKKRIVSETMGGYVDAMHKTIEPTILYFGTPVALISSLNENGSPNICPMSSAWWLGWSCMLGLGAMSKTSDNLIRTRECVINLPSQDQVSHVDRLALTTGKDPVPEKKQQWGYRHEADKFDVAGLTPTPSLVVGPPRIRECPIQMEGIVHDVRPFGKNVTANVFEVHILKVHVDKNLLLENGRHIDPVRWRPLIMSFCRFFGMGDEIHPSRLAESPFMKMVGAPPQQPSTDNAVSVMTSAQR